MDGGMKFDGFAHLSLVIARWLSRYVEHLRLLANESTTRIREPPILLRY